MRQPSDQTKPVVFPTTPRQLSRKTIKHRRNNYVNVPAEVDFPQGERVFGGKTKTNARDQ